MPAAPPVVAAFLTELADRGLKPSTIGRRLAAIVFAHQTAGHTPPPDQVGSAILERAVRGVCKDKRDESVDKKRASDGDVLRDMLRAIEGDRRGVERTSALPSTAIESCPRPSSRSKPLRADCKKGAKPSLHTDEPTTAIGKQQTRHERRLLGHGTAKRIEVLVRAEPNYNNLVARKGMLLGVMGPRHDTTS